MVYSPMGTVHQMDFTVYIGICGSSPLPPFLLLFYMFVHLVLGLIVLTFIPLVGIYHIIIFFTIPSLYFTFWHSPFIYLFLLVIAPTHSSISVTPFLFYILLYTILFIFIIDGYAGMLTEFTYGILFLGTAGHC